MSKTDLTLSVQGTSEKDGNVTVIDQAKEHVEALMAFAFHDRTKDSCERGSNENANRMIRRFIPKGANIGKMRRKDIQAVEEWINNYPRRIHGFRSANALFEEHIASLTR